MGGSTLTGPVSLTGAVFYARVTDAIFAFPFVYYQDDQDTTGTLVNQSRNVGDGNYYGAEFSFDAPISSTLTAGGNYTFLRRDLNDPSVPDFEPTGVPRHKAFLYAEWRPMTALHVTPSIDITSDRWAASANGSGYFRTGSHVDASLRFDYDINENVSMGAGVRNLFDELYYLTDGFPEAGRRFFISLRMKN